MDLAQVTLTQLRYAVAIEDAGNFRLAAQASHVSQSGLSMQVAKLEELLGVVLFDRSKKPVLVTEEGKSVLKQMRTVLREVERLAQVVSEESEPSGRYRLGVIPSMAPTMLPLFLGSFARKYPRVELLIEELKTDEIVARLGADTLDAGLLSTPLDVDGIHETVLGREAMFAYLPPDDPLASRRAVPQKELEGRDLLLMAEGHCFRSQVLAYCQSRGPNKGHTLEFESGSLDTLVRLTDEGVGMTVIPELVAKRLSTARRRAQLRPLTSPPPVREIGLVTARKDLRRHVTEVLAAEIRYALERELEDAPRRALVLDPVGAA